jgi:hypothetical protein
MLVPLAKLNGAPSVDPSLVLRSKLAARAIGSPRRAVRVVKQNVVLTLVKVAALRSFHVDGVRGADLRPIVRENLSREAAMMTDELQRPGGRILA